MYDDYKNFNELANSNIRWFEDHTASIIWSINHRVPMMAINFSDSFV